MNCAEPLALLDSWKF